MTGSPRYFIGAQPVFSARFVNAAGAAANPTTVTFIFVDPAGVETTTSSPNAAITNPSTGTWVYTWPAAAGVTTVGMWDVRVKGVGAAIGASEGTFEVLPSLVLTP